MTGIFATIVIIANNCNQHEAITDTALSISQADIKYLEELYTFRQKTEIIQFLDQYPFLVAPLQSVGQKVRSYFPNEQLFLRIDHDPEIIDYVHLVLSILTERDPHDALNRRLAVP